VNEYLLTHPDGRDQLRRNASADQTDLDVLLEHHRFIWEDDDDQGEDGKSSLSWGQRLAKKYYERLYREYCICDLSRYDENKVRLSQANLTRLICDYFGRTMTHWRLTFSELQIAMRWRTEKEVIGGKGQFACAAKNCDVSDRLTSWEVNFAYKEQNQKKNALVKIRKWN
jgi:protein FRA10AC1